MYIYVCISVYISILKIQGVFLNCTYFYIEDRNYTLLNNRHVACDFYFFMNAFCSLLLCFRKYLHLQRNAKCFFFIGQCHLYTRVDQIFRFSWLRRHVLGWVKKRVRRNIIFFLSVPSCSAGPPKFLRVLNRTSIFLLTEIGCVWYQKMRILTLILTRQTWFSQKMHPIRVKLKKPDFW